MTPHRAPSPYADYMVLEFKDGIFKAPRISFMQLTTPDIEDLPLALTLRLKRSPCDSTVIKEIYRKP